MKIFKSIVIFFIVLSFLNANDFASEYGYAKNYDQGYAKAKELQKPLLVLFVTKTCPWCKKLENQTLSKPSVSTKILENFVPVLLDKDTDIYPQYLSVQVVPTIHFIIPSESKSFQMILGYKSQQTFLKLLEDAKKQFEDRK
ncbi:MAG: thioredoxin family protein [Sulfurospirillum sp.]|nr:thioredoxin family protein [Sulfurospirillum sp.]